MARLPLLLGALLSATVSPAQSQDNVSPPIVSVPTARIPHAADARVSIPPLIYRSPFNAYRADQVEELLPWREVNDRVGSIGGWRVYAREAQSSSPEALPKASATGNPPPATR